MSLRIFGLIGFGILTTSFATITGFSAYDNYQHNSKMKQYDDWREAFFLKISSKNSLENTVCKNKTECLGGKGYFPKPYENIDWEKAYKSLENERQQDNQKNIFSNINNSEDLKDYCYLEIQKDLLNQQDFHPSGSGKGRHDLCVLSENQLKK